MDGSEPGKAAVWCDFGGVLTAPIADALDQVVRAARVPVDPLLGAIEQVAASFGGRGLDPLELGLISEPDWGEQVRAALAPDWVPAIDLGRFGEYWYEGRVAEHDLLARLGQLRPLGVRLGLLTNSIREWEPHRQALMPGVWSVFEQRINSFEVGVRKPDAEIYALAEQAFGLAGAECLLIDDLEANCAAAAERGWAAILHSSAEATAAELDTWLAGRVNGSAPDGA
jgi:putative hydrolase of the HAD superfamily